MKIAILNDCYFSKDHLDRLSKLGELAVFSGTTSSELAVERLKGVDIAVVDGFLTNYDKDLLKQAGELKFVSLNTTSFSMVDILSAREMGISIANVPGFSQEAVAELTLTLILAANRNIVRGDRRFRNNPVDDLDPASSEGESYMGFELRSRTIGIVGLGRIGRRVAELCSAIGMNVLGYNRTELNIPNVKQVDLPTLLSSSDVVSLNIALTDETTKIIGAKEIAMMKTESILINVGRAQLVDTDSLYEALRKKRIRAAGLDITDIQGSHPITQLENVIFTPHIGSCTVEAYKNNLPEIIVSNIEAFVAGKPINIVN